MSVYRQRLDGIKVIAEYLGLSLRQTYKLYQVTVPEDERLPVFRLTPDAGKNARLYAYVDELDTWQDRVSERAYERHREAHGRVPRKFSPSR